MTPRYRVTLTLPERDHLTALSKDASTRAKRFLYARALLLCDQGPHGPSWTVSPASHRRSASPHEPSNA